MNQKPLTRPAPEKSSPDSGVKENNSQTENLESAGTSLFLSRLVANPRISPAQKQVLVQRYGAKYGNQQVQRLLKATQNSEVQRAPVRSVHNQKAEPNKLPQDKKKGSELLQIRAGTFEEAAKQFLELLSEVNYKGQVRILIINGNNLRVFNEKGQLASPKAFRFQVPVTLPTAVYVPVAHDPYLHGLTRDDKGKLGVSKFSIATDEIIDLAKTVKDYEELKKILEGANERYVVVPATKVDDQDKARELPNVMDKDLPEFMKLGETEEKATHNAYDAEMKPLTPQIASVNSVGSFLMEVHKDVGMGMADRVLRVAQSISFHWQVLKIDAKDQIVASDNIGHFAGFKDAYKRRMRHSAEDYDSLLGDDRDKQSGAEKAARHAVAAPLTGARAVLGVAGETVHQFINSVAGGVDVNYQSIMEVPWQQPGEYFVRCLATPLSKKGDAERRATSVAGVRVSVFDIAALAQEALPSVDQEQKTAKARLTDAEEEYKLLNDLSNDEQQELSEQDFYRLNELDIELEYLREKEKVAGDPLAQKKARVKYLQNLIEYLKSSRSSRQQKSKLGEREAELKQLQGELKRADSRLGLKPGEAKMMSGVYVNDTTAATQPVDFAISEHPFLNPLSNTEQIIIRIADITAENGRMCSGAGNDRAEAWKEALRDLRNNLGRGRGMLSYRPPAPYDQIKTDLPNPMRLQISLGDQLHETMEDAAHVATLAAVVAAIPTGGASLGLLGILAPIQAGLSLYRIVDRAQYGTLELDAEAVADFINIASFGLANVGEAAPLSSKGVQMLFSANKVAMRLLDAGNYAVMSYQTYKQLTYVPEGLDPREASRYRLQALLSFFEGAGIPISTHMYHKAGLQAKTRARAGQESEAISAGKETPAIKPGASGDLPEHTPRPGTSGETHSVPDHQTRPGSADKSHPQPDERVESISVEDSHGQSDHEGASGGSSAHPNHEPGNKATGHGSEGQVKAVIEEIQNNEAIRNQLLRHDPQVIREVLSRARNWKELLGSLESGSPMAKQIGRAILQYREAITAQLHQRFKLKIIGSKEWISDVDYIIEGESAGEHLVAAEKWMRENLGEHWSEMLRANFYTEATRLIKYEEVLKHLTPEENAIVQERMTEMTEVHNLARMLQHAYKVKAETARKAAVAEVKSLAEKLGLKPDQMAEMERLGSLDESTILALRDLALPKIDALVKRFNRSTNPKERIDLAVQITQMQIRGNFYTKEAYIGPGAGRQTVQGQKVSGHEAYQAALSHYEMFKHIVGEHGGDLIKAAREYELFKYVHRFTEAARGAGLSGPELKFFEEMGAYLYQVDRLAHTEGIHRQNRDTNEIRAKARDKSTGEKSLPFPKDTSPGEVTPEFLRSLSNDFVRMAERTLPEMRRKLESQSHSSTENGPGGGATTKPGATGPETSSSTPKTNGEKSQPGASKAQKPKWGENREVNPGSGDNLWHLPDVSIVQSANPRKLGDHLEIYKNMIAPPPIGQPDREAMVLKNERTGEYIVVQGNEGKAVLDRDKVVELLGRQHRWDSFKLVRHAHPQRLDKSWRSTDILPSGASGDFRWLFREYEESHSDPDRRKAVSSEIDVFMRDGSKRVTRFGIQPGEKKPWWVEVPVVGPGNKTQTFRFASLQKYHQFIERQGARVTPVPPEMHVPLP
jgi:hypothetical protein